MKNLLVAVDLSSTDARLIDVARNLARAFQSHVHLLHVAPPDPDFVGYEVGPQHIRDVLAEELRQEHRLLRTYADELQQEGITASALMIQGPTADMIRTEVEKLKSDLLLLGSHRHGLMYELFIGHTSSRVLKDISIPVMIIPLDDAT